MVICGRVVGGRLGTFLGRVVSVTAGSLVWGAIWRILEVIWLGRRLLALLLLHLFICPSIHASIYLFNYLSGGLFRTSWKTLGKPLGLLGPFLGRLWGGLLLVFVPASSKHPNPTEQIPI